MNNEANFSDYLKSKVLLVGILALCVLCCFVLSRSSAEGLKTEMKIDELAQYQELQFTTKKGVKYTLQKSTDLTNWNDDLSFLGNGELVKLRLFALNENVTPQNGNDVAFEMVSGNVRKVNSGGTYVSWISLEDESVKHAYFPAVELDANFPNSYVGLKNGYYLFLNLEGPLTVIDSDSVVHGKDLIFKNALAGLIAGLNNDILNGTSPQRPHRPLAIQNKQFWRINTNSALDSDGDGVSNEDENENGTDPFDNDTDNDGVPDSQILDKDGDGVVDTNDADPLDKAITWKKVVELPYVVTEIILPAGVDLADDWNYDLGEGGHMLLSRTTTLTWDESAQMFDKSSFKTYVYDEEKWSDNLPLSDTIRGLGVSIDSLGNVYGIGYGPPENPNGLGIYAVSFKWDKPVTLSTETDPIWGAPVMEEQRELFTYSTAHEDTTKFINLFYNDSPSGKNFLYGTTGHFIVGSDLVTGGSALHRQNPNGRITTSLPALDAPVYFHIAGEPNGWHAASWFEVTNSGVQTKHIFSKLTSENLLIDANPPTGDALLQLTDIASVKGGGIPAGISDILTWSYGSDGLLIGSRSVEDGAVTWLASTKEDQSQRISGKINSRGEGLLPTKLWRNGKWTPLDNLVDSTLWPNIVGIDINSSGSILARSGTRLIIIKPISEVDITVVFGIGPEPQGEITSRNLLESYLETVKKSKNGDVWVVEGKDSNDRDKLYVVELASDEATLIKALESRGRIVVFEGHSNFGLGPNFEKTSVKTIDSFTNFGVGYTDIPLAYFSAGNEPDWQKMLDDWQLATNAWQEEYSDWNKDYAPPGQPEQPEEASEAQGRFLEEGFAYIRVLPDQIMQNPLNYIPAPLKLMRFPNNNGVAVGQPFPLQQNGNQSFHYTTTSGSRRLMVTAPETDLPETLKYKTFFYNACSTGPDYIENFNHGELVFTNRSCWVFRATQIFVKSTIEGNTATETIPLLNILGVANENPNTPLDTYEIQTF